MPGKSLAMATPGSRWGWFVAAATVLAAGGTGYSFALAQMWFGLTMLSVGMPAVALITWYQQRRRGAAARRAADQMLVPFALAEIFLSMLLETSREREQELKAECLQRQRIEAADCRSASGPPTPQS